jgi:uncharacterized protein (TIGR02391 family)
MNLSTHISDRLWEAVAAPYEAGNYAHAILEGMHVITEVLREKSGLDGDGQTLVGGALGGENPKVRLNRLQTDTERNVQKGFEHILRGMYSAVRNPRSHESAIDIRENADAILYFVDYLLMSLSASRAGFSTETFLQKVTDKDYVSGSDRYSELMAADVPQGRVGDVLVALFGARETTPLQDRGRLRDALLRRASDAQIESFLAVVSDTLASTENDGDIRAAFQMLTPELWPRLREVARLRVESKIVKMIRKGRLDENRKTAEWLATWTRDFIKRFDTREDIATVLYLQLSDENPANRRYVLGHFMPVLPDICLSEQEVARVVSAMARHTKAKDAEMRTALMWYTKSFPAGWQKLLAEALKGMTNPEKPALRLEDGTPFLEELEDDIPF